MKLTKNFSLKEFLHNRWASPSELRRIEASFNAEVEANIIELANNLQVLRDHLGAPITITIAFRPLWWEKERDRSGGSKHVLGQAADIVVRGYTPKQVEAAIQALIDQGKMKEGGLKGYATFTHYDIRGVRARW